MSSFTNKVVLVTGASAGIGLATARLLAVRGAQVALAARSQPALEEARAQCGPRAIAVCADVATDHGCESLVKTVLEHFGRLDVLINNAASGTRSTIQSANMAAFDSVMNTNLRGVYNITQLCVPALIATRGAIVNVSSVVATMCALGALPYSVSKAALNHFSRLVALELAPKGVRVNVVSPGVTRTEFVKRITGYTPEQYDSWLAKSTALVPTGKVIEPEQVAEAIAFLAGDESAMITGAVLPVDAALGLRGVGANLYEGQVEAPRRANENNVMDDLS